MFQAVYCSFLNTIVVKLILLCAGETRLHDCTELCNTVYYAVLLMMNDQIRSKHVEQKTNCGIKIDYKNCASRWSLTLCYMMHGTHNVKLEEYRLRFDTIHIPCSLQTYKWGYRQAMKKAKDIAETCSYDFYYYYEEFVGYKPFSQTESVREQGDTEGIWA